MIASSEYGLANATIMLAVTAEEREALHPTVSAGGVDDSRDVPGTYAGAESTSRVGR